MRRIRRNKCCLHGAPDALASLSDYPHTRSNGTSMLRLLASLIALSTTCAVAAEADEPVTADRCMAQIQAGRSDWIECYAEFETDAAAQEELSRQTFDMVQGARCGGTIRVLRAALTRALILNGVLELDPHEVLCSIATSGGAESQVTVTLAPKVSFQAGRIADISPRILSIADLPNLLVGPLRSAAESDFVRGQLTKGVNMYLEQALQK
jgi:hypothetical protein